jgi:DNA protecting protein DprA
MITEASPILNLLLAKGVGTKTLSEIVEKLAAQNLSPEDIGIDALADELNWRAEFKNSALAVQEQADELAEQLERQSIRILVRSFGLYPKKLIRALGKNAPPVLFAKGNLSILDAKAVGFCGSRHASEKGIRVAAESAKLLGPRGVNVVSGYAAGVDLAAHCAALDAGGVTTIVLAEGILHFRPKREIKQLFTDDNYLVVSEYSPRLPWNARHAMQRNNTIIGLSDAMIVIESGTTGGTHACGEAAMQLGHPLFVAEYAAPANSAEGNKNFLDRGAMALRGDRQGLPNLTKVFEVLALNGHGESSPATVVASKAVEPNHPSALRSATKPTITERTDTMAHQAYPKRLIEVDLPIFRISAHSRREKSIRHGHISTLHIWWARRPLAACRAVICAALWPDPADPLCPPAFRVAAIDAIKAFASRVFPQRLTEEGHQLQETLSTESHGRWDAIAAGTLTLDASRPVDMPILRLALLDFIADFANWDNSTVPAYLETSRSLTQSAHEALGGAHGTRPLVVDPFAGGGSIPLEALRVGADAFASDLNPVPVLLNKIVLEYKPKYGERLVQEIRKWGAWVKSEAEKQLAAFHPNDADGAVPVAYLWARTTKCEGPGCGAIVPLIRNMQLTRDGKFWHFTVDDTDGLSVSVSVESGKRAVHRPTVAGGSVTCPRESCGYTTPAKAVRAQLVAKHGGANDAKLLAVYVERNGQRLFRNPTESDNAANILARTAVLHEDLPQDTINPIRPYKNTRGLSAVTRIGITRFCDLYTARQALAIRTVQRILLRLPQFSDDAELRSAVLAILNCAVSRFIFQNCSLSRWNAARSTIEGAFGKQALQVVWDFAEINPLSDGPANWNGAIEWIRKVLEANSCLTHSGTVVRGRAQDQLLPADAADALITDPPYFAAIPYGDLSNVFLVWEREFFRNAFPDLYDPGLVRQGDEIVVTNANVDAQGNPKTPEFYRREMIKALVAARVALKPGGIGVVVFAESRTDSWEVMLGAVIEAGWLICGSWPIDTELQTRTQASGSASLQSSVHIICRPREDASGAEAQTVGEWRDVLGELPPRIHEWMPRLAAEGVFGADAIFACLGPALEIFSRYCRVEKSNGEQATLGEYLEQVWAAVSTEALSLIFNDADAAGLEPDARLTAMWLWTIGGGGTNGNGAKSSPIAADTNSDEDVGSDDDEESSGSGGKGKAVGGFALEYDAARKIAQGLGVHLEQCESLVEIKGDKARLLAVAERTPYLFGKGSQATSSGAGRKKKVQQKSLFANLDEAEAAEAGWTELKGPPPGTTVLDRVHQTMILFAANRGELLKRFLVEDGIGRDARFWKLADNLNKLYPPGTDERRWIESVLARKKGLGL